MPSPEETAAALADEANALWDELGGGMRDWDGFQVTPSLCVDGVQLFLLELWGGARTTPLPPHDIREAARRYLHTRLGREPRPRRKSPDLPEEKKPMNAHAATPPTETPFLLAPIAKITKGRNYRKRHPRDWESKLDELAQSIREHGVIEPIVIRPLPGGAPDEYEHVVGERRLLGATRAGLEAIPAVLRQIADDQVLDLQLVENNQRDDVHPLDEAEGFKEATNNGRTPAEIAERIGRDVRYVVQRLALCSLSEKCWKALDEDRIIFGVALALARIPSAKLQDEALARIASGGRAHPDEVMTVKAAAELIRDEFMLELGKAPFDRADASLVEKAGACATCPKRTGNQTELFGDVGSPDVCTDRLCFKSKLDAHWKIVSLRAKKDGKAVLPEAEAKKLWPYEHSDIYGSSSYQKLTGSVSDPKTHRETSVRALLKGRDFNTTLARNPHTGAIVELVAKTAIDSAFKAKAKERSSDKEKKEAKARAKLTPAEKRKREEAKLKAEAKTAINARLLGELAERCESQGANGIEPWFDALLELLVECAEGMSTTLERRGLVSANKHRRYDANAEIIRREYKARGLAWLRGLLLEAFVSEFVDYNYGPRDEYSKRFDRALEAFGVDRKATEQIVLSELKAERERSEAAGAHEKVARKSKGSIHLWDPSGLSKGGTACGASPGKDGVITKELSGATCENCKRVGPGVLRDRKPAKARKPGKLETKARRLKEAVEKLPPPEDGEPYAPPREAKGTPGTCRGCGCTDAEACDGGCYWTDDAHTLCSSCAGGQPKGRQSAKAE